MQTRQPKCKESHLPNPTDETRKEGARLRLYNLAKFRGRDDDMAYPMQDSFSGYQFTHSTTFDQDLKRAIQGILRIYNAQVSTIKDPDTKEFNITVTNANGEFVGGIMARLYWGWLVIDLLAVEETARSQGIGKYLLQQAELEGQKQGCTRSHTSTYGFQALTFYQQFGYRVIGQLDDYPDGMTFYWLRKELIRDKHLAN